MAYFPCKRTSVTNDMNPFQGLKRRQTGTEYPPAASHKRHESLSGIETFRSPFAVPPRRSEVTNDMNPFQGLKLLVLNNQEHVLDVTNDMNPFQGLKRL